MKRDSLTPYLWMIEACLLFTAMATMAHFLRDSCPWQLIAAVRAGLVLVLVAIMARLRRQQVFVLGTPMLWIRSISGSLSMVCTFYAFTHLPISDTLTLTNMFPIWVALLSWPLLGEKPPGSVWLAILSGSVGVWLIQQPHFGSRDVAVACAAAASLFTAVAMLGLHRLHDIQPTTIVVHFSAVATFFCLGSWFLFDRTYSGDLAVGWIALLLLGIGLVAAVGQLLLTKAFAAGNPSRVAVVSLCQIAFAIVPDVLLFRHDLHITSLIGIALITAPTAWVMLQAHTTPPLAEPLDESEAASDDNEITSPTSVAQDSSLSLPPSP